MNIFESTLTGALRLTDCRRNRRPPACAGAVPANRAAGTDEPPAGLFQFPFLFHQRRLHQYDERRRGCSGCMNDAGGRSAGSRSMNR